MTDSPVVGSASFELRAERRKLKEDIKASEADLKAAMGGIERDANQGARSIGASIGRMAGVAMSALTGLVTVMGLAATGALNFGMQGMRMADEIASTARRIGIGTDALQEWRYVAERTGGAARDADQALDAFSLKFSQAASRVKKDAVDAFDLIQLKPEQLKSFTSVEAALEEVIDRIKALGSEADRAAVIEALGLGPLAPALRDAAVDVAKLRDEARNLGLVLDAELIKRAAAAQRELDQLSDIIDMQLKSAFLDLAPAIVSAMNLVAQFAQSLGDALDVWKDLDSRTARGLKREDQRLAAEQLAVINAAGAPGNMRGSVRARRVEGEDYTLVGLRDRGGSAMPSARRDPTLNLWENISRNASEPNRVVDVYAAEHFNALNNRRRQIAQELVERAATNRAPTLTNREGGNTLTLPPPRADNSAQREAEREARRSERVEQEILRARVRALGIADKEAMTVQERFDLEQAQVILEREAEAKELESRKARGDITQAELDQLKLILDQTATLEDRVAADILARDLADERLAQERVLSDLTANLVSLQVSAARTAEERRRLELDLLAITQRQRRQALELQMERERWSEPRRAEARSSLGRIEGAERDAVNRNNLSPLQRWREESLRSAGEIEEAYERVAVNGLGALTDGITDAITGTRTLGEVFASVARQIIADLTRIAVRRAIIEPLANALFPGSGTLFSSFGFGSGNVGSSVLSGLGKAAGSFGAPATPITGLSLPSLDGGLGKLGAGPASAPALRTLRIEVDKSDLFEVKVREVAAPVAAQTAGLALNQARVDQANIMRRNRQRFV